MAKYEESKILLEACLVFLNGFLAHIDRIIKINEAKNGSQGIFPNSNNFSASYLEFKNSVMVCSNRINQLLSEISSEHTVQKTLQENSETTSDTKQSSLRRREVSY